MAYREEQFGQIDIDLFDQLLKGRLVPDSRVLDAGCGRGRNIVYLLRAGCDVFGADVDAESIQAVRHLAESIAPRLPAETFRVEPIEAMSFPDAFADTVICSTVLHFARDDDHFGAMLDGTWRLLRPGGVFFSRLASSIGVEDRMQRIDGRRCLLPDGAV
jgi:SAM-dependent methyltransferase